MQHYFCEGLEKLHVIKCNIIFVKDFNNYMYNHLDNVKNWCLLMSLSVVIKIFTFWYFTFWYFKLKKNLVKQ